MHKHGKSTPVHINNIAKTRTPYGRRSDCPDHIRQWLYCREFGNKPTLGWKNKISNQLYSSIKTVKSWIPGSTVNQTHHGSIFNFGFSTDGSILAAACELGSILLFDPQNGKLIEAKNKAHGDCVNCVRFLDSRTFSTCSDDHTVCLWDVRYMKSKIKTLNGHSHWVKNIDYAQDSGLLMTSGFDGCIYTWDINRYSDKDQSAGKQVFHTNGLMRSRLTPDASKLIISTAGGYIMVVHDLDLENLSNDLKGFLPNMYRLMQISSNQSGLRNRFSRLFTRKRNRVEIIGDFPRSDDAEMITSLEVHPQGWCVGTRNTAADEHSEWTCIHDIQGSKNDYKEEIPTEETPDQASAKDEPLRYTPSSERDTAQQSGRGIRGNYSVHSQTMSLMSHMLSGLRDITSGSERIRAPLSVSIRIFPPSPQSSTHEASGEDSSDEESSDSADEEEEPVSSQTERALDAEVQDSAQDTDLSSGGATAYGDSARNNQAVSSDSAPSQAAHVSTAAESSNFRQNLVEGDQNPTLFLDGFPQNVTFSFNMAAMSEESASTRSRLGFMSDAQHDSPDAASNTDVSSSDVIYPSVPRLTHYIEEPNVGRGYIKELCFSQDGRLVCSPFGYGVRLLAFDPCCHEVCDCLPESPVQLYEVASNMSHSREVVTTKFSPTHCLLVSGCLNGKVDFHQPIL